MRKVAVVEEGRAGAGTFPQPSAGPWRVLAGLPDRESNPGPRPPPFPHLLVTVLGNPQVSVDARKASRVS